MEVADDHVKTVDQAATCDVTCPLLREAVTVTQRDTGSVTRHGQCHGLCHVADIHNQIRFLGPPVGLVVEENTYVHAPRFAQKDQG